MSSADIQITAIEPFIQKFTLAILKVFKEKNIETKEKFILHDDLIPKVSPEVRGRLMAPRKIASGKGPVIELKKSPLPFEEPMNTSIGQEIKQDINSNIRQGLLPLPPLPPLEESLPALPPLPPKNQASPNLPTQMPFSKPQVHSKLVSNQEPIDPLAFGPYGRITPLLDDPSVIVIECNGPGKKVNVIRHGQKQATRIILSAEEIQMVLDTISAGAHIPLMEGIFRAAIEDFSVTAIISEIVGSKFSIKKQLSQDPTGQYA